MANGVLQANGQPSNPEPQPSIGPRSTGDNFRTPGLTFRLAPGRDKSNHPSMGNSGFGIAGRREGDLTCLFSQEPKTQI
jgi:hypothetical protein